MRLFYVINGWAGRSDWLDGALRFFYVGAVPLLFTALAALLILAPRRQDALNYVAPRRHIALATLLSCVLCALVVAGVTLFQKQFLGGAPISPRPFMTHWVHPLIVEPNDNSFPCFEVMLAAVAATMLWANLPAAGVIGWSAVALLGFARIFCGMNYFADSFAGAIIGGAIATFCLAVLRIPLQLPTWQADTRRLSWRVRHQAVFSTLTIIGFLIFAGYSLKTSPAHGSKFKYFFGGTTATAAPVAAPISSAKVASATLTAGIHEGEGGVLAEGHSNTMSEPGELLLASRAARLDGHLPEAEVHLMGVLESLRLPHRIVGVNVAQVRAGNSAYRVAAIRFEVKEVSSAERRRVAETAAQCVKRAFHADAQLQHIDVLGIKFHVEMQTGSTERTATRPVFTASIERDDLIVENKPAWVNWSGLDGGAWLRARSELYIDPEALPAMPVATKPVTKQPAPKPVLKQPTPPPVVPVKPKLAQPKPTQRKAAQRKAAQRKVVQRKPAQPAPKQLAPTQPAPQKPITPQPQPIAPGAVRPGNATPEATTTGNATSGTVKPNTEKPNGDQSPPVKAGVAQPGVAPTKAPAVGVPSTAGTKSTVTKPVATKPAVAPSGTAQPKTGTPGVAQSGIAKPPAKPAVKKYVGPKKRSVVKRKRRGSSRRYRSNSYRRSR